MAARRSARLLGGAVALGVLTALAGSAAGSTPATSPTLTPSSTIGADVRTSWSGTIPAGVDSDSDCTLALDPSLVDHHGVSLRVPSTLYATRRVTATLTLTPTDPVDDAVLTVVAPGAPAASADDGGPGAGEALVLTDPAPGSYDVLACAYAGPSAQAYTASLVLHTTAIPPDKAVAGGTAPGITAPTYANHTAPGTLAAHAGEPSIGVNWKTGAAFLQAGLETDKVTFDAAGRPTWTDVSGPTTSVTSLDPILASDDAQGRVLVSQLTGFDSASAFTDNDGRSYTPSQGGGIPSGIDHQTVGFGPYPAGAVPGPLTSFPDAAYYCSQESLTAFCARSDTGGLSFGPGVPIYNATQCGFLHGHVRVSPDGTVYVPNNSCGGHQGFAVSTDAGLTWAVRTDPRSTKGIDDPSVAAGKDDTVYFGYVDGDGRPLVSVTRNRGVSFSRPVAVGAALGLRNASFPTVIAGDGDRAAFAFLGTTTAGDPQNPDFGKNAAKTAYTGGAYRLYVATTYDRGVHWTTVDATGADLVQRGKVCLGGTVGCGPKDRNLLDFMDIQVDQQGRVLVGWADGCTGTCLRSTKVADNTFSSKGVITRQVSGAGLFAARPAARTSALRPAAPGVPAAPRAGGGAGGAGLVGGGAGGGGLVGGWLAATGLPWGVPVLGLGLLAVVVGLRRRSA